MGELQEYSSISIVQEITPLSPQRPDENERDAWKVFWTARKQEWRTEPEISVERQQELEMRRAITPQLEKGIYPFKDFKLNRADVEWLLATHDNGRGPVDANDASQRTRSGLDLRGADLCNVDLSNLPLAHLRGGPDRSERLTATLEQREMAACHLRGANLRHTHLERASLGMVDLRESNLRYAHLEEAFLFRGHFEGAYLYDTHLDGSTLRHAFFDVSTTFHNTTLGSVYTHTARLANINWGGVNLLQIDWDSIKILGDELEARQKGSIDGQVKNTEDMLEGYRVAIQANRQLAVTLQSQGLNEDAARFAYRAQILQKDAFWDQMMMPGLTHKQRLHAFQKWFFSAFLYWISGYGYKPGRSFLCYFLAITGFATIYYLLGRSIGPAISPIGCFVLSMTSFHGRGFFPSGNIPLDSPITVLAAIEALFGLIIEATFIATLTKRLFNH